MLRALGITIKFPLGAVRLRSLSVPFPVHLPQRACHSIRNVGIFAHIDAGKTTTSESILYLCGATRSVGLVDTGDTVMDFLPQERERGITISAAAVSCNWKGYTINLIDT
jgi:elongation factor G